MVNESIISSCIECPCCLGRRGRYWQTVIHENMQLYAILSWNSFCTPSVSNGSVGARCYMRTGIFIFLLWNLFCTPGSGCTGVRDIKLYAILSLTSFCIKLAVVDVLVSGVTWQLVAAVDVLVLGVMWGQVATACQLQVLCKDNGDGGYVVSCVTWWQVTAACVLRMLYEDRWQQCVCCRCYMRRDGSSRCVGGVIWGQVTAMDVLVLAVIWGQMTAVVVLVLAVILGQVASAGVLVLAAMWGQVASADVLVLAVMWGQVAAAGVLVLHHWIHWCQLFCEDT